MQTFDFDLLLKTPAGADEISADAFLDAAEEPFFDVFEGDVTPSLMGGHPVLYCSIEAETLDAALHRVVGETIRLGFHPVTLQMTLEQRGFAAA